MTFSSNVHHYLSAFVNYGRLHWFLYNMHHWASTGPTTVQTNSHLFILQVLGFVCKLVSDNGQQSVSVKGMGASRRDFGGKFQRAIAMCIIQSSCNLKHHYTQLGVLWFLLRLIGEFQQVRLSLIFLVMFLI